MLHHKSCMMSEGQIQDIRETLEGRCSVATSGITQVWPRPTLSHKIITYETFFGNVFLKNYEFHA